MTRILITTFGTRGDVQPYIALGKGLKAAGYETGICTSEGYRSFVEEHGLTYVFMNNELLRLTQAALTEVNGIRDGVRIARQMQPAMRSAMDDEWHAAQAFGSDLILYHPKCLGSYHIAEKLNIPAVMSIPLPFYTPTRAFPVPFMSGIRLGGWFNHFSYRLMGLSNGMFSGTVNDFRVKTLNMPPVGRFTDLLVRSDGTSVPVLYPYSPYLLPVPDDFPPHVHVTGYWFLDHTTDWQPDPALVDFLNAGTPPVYVGFGSIGGRKGEERAGIVFDALTKTGQRGVLVSGWGGLKATDMPSNAFMAESIPHDWLFPQVAAVVHHGGAGTTAAGLRAGKPTMICPFMADQPFWGKLVYERGIGPEPVPQSKLTVDRLATAIHQAVTDSTMQQRAAELGEKIRGEDGIARAVEIIRSIISPGYAGKFPPLEAPSAV
jgi:sterol 3beta-glucosyltransferase